MNWRFWEPKHTVESVARRLVAGLRDGSIVIGEPLVDEPFDDEIDDAEMVLQMDLGTGMSNDEILEVVKQCVRCADEQNRSQGGQGLNLEAVRVESPMLKVALRPKSKTEPASAV